MPKLLLFKKLSTRHPIPHFYWASVSMVTPARSWEVVWASLFTMIYYSIPLGFLFAEALNWLLYYYVYHLGNQFICALFIARRCLTQRTSMYCYFHFYPIRFIWAILMHITLLRVWELQIRWVYIYWIFVIYTVCLFLVFVMHLLYYPPVALLVAQI